MWKLQEINCLICIFSLCRHGAGGRLLCLRGRGEVCPGWGHPRDIFQCFNTLSFCKGVWWVNGISFKMYKAKKFLWHKFTCVLVGRGFFHVGDERVCCSEAGAAQVCCAKRHRLSSLNDKFNGHTTGQLLLPWSEPSLDTIFLLICEYLNLYEHLKC